MGPRPQLPWAAPAGASPPSFAHKRLEAGVGVVRGTVASSRLVRPAVQAEVAAGGDPEEVVVGIDNLCHELRWKKVFCFLTLGSLMLCCTILCSISAFGSLPGPDEKINAIKLFSDRSKCHLLPTQLHWDPPPRLPKFTALRENPWFNLSGSDALKCWLRKLPLVSNSWLALKTLKLRHLLLSNPNCAAVHTSAYLDWEQRRASSQMASPPWSHESHDWTVINA